MCSTVWGAASLGEQARDRPADQALLRRARRPRGPRAVRRFAGRGRWRVRRDRRTQRLRQDHAAQHRRRAADLRYRVGHDRRTGDSGPWRQSRRRLSALQPAAVAHHRRQRPLRDGDPEAVRRRRDARAHRRASSSWSAWPDSSPTIRRSCRAACSSGSIWRAHWRRIRRCCSWTSRLPRSTRRRASTCSWSC